jgi:hypothetical protein
VIEAGMRRSTIIYSLLGAFGGFLFGFATCFALSFVFVMLGCPEAKGQACRKAVGFAESISKNWYLFAVAGGVFSGFTGYFLASNGRQWLRTIISENRTARTLVYLLGGVAFSLALLNAAVAAFVTSARASLECPSESAFECSEASSFEVFLGILIVVIALSVAVVIVVGVYRITGKDIVLEEFSNT